MEASLDTGRSDGENEPLGIADELMARGDHLRMLRQLEKTDEEERERLKEEEESRTMKNEEESDFDCIASLSNGQRVLRYESYLRHQRYYDDLKHIDCTFIDYGVIGNGRLIIEQEKKLGKGGLCWDAAFILGEHMIDCKHEWMTEPSSKMVELGSGTGLCGAMIARAVPKSRVEITDLPELKDLMERNIALNFDYNSIVSKTQNTSSFSDEDLNLLFGAEDKNKSKSAVGCISASILRWGCDEDYGNGPYDVIFGADVVASLYDPVALAAPSTHSATRNHRFT
eukprot:CAMPEP_0195284754 /NCGR_PEP_ID=MMETSP0707-20130614/2849_1 /TAXON_ID=33640 /ORGANISM="Asterionellopsis glacialis, Strain CCMP134" /LENGTH=283 /DNA_ID=CAMNT_0040344147 /DNA_START=161 /DNA_END=1013 /DNA_ORIENTATION=-